MLVVAQLVKKFPAFCQTLRLSRLDKQATGGYIKPDEFSVYPNTQ
jgi:hypothetical protein